MVGELASAGAISSRLLSPPESVNAMFLPVILS